MKLDQLRKIIREEVRAAVKEELQEVMNEAVKYASTPTTQQYTKVPKNQPKKWSFGASATLDEMLSATKAEMTKEEATNILGYSGTMKPNFASSMANQMGMNEQVGIDITNIPGVDLNKAKSIINWKKK